jgi:hypothetical protein
MQKRYEVIKGISRWYIIDNHTGKQLDCEAKTPEDAQFLADRLNEEHNERISKLAEDTVADILQMFKENGVVIVPLNEWERLKEMERGLLQLCTQYRVESK